MPDSHDQVEIQIGDRSYAGWQRYEIDSSLLVPADGWRVSLTSLDAPAAASVDAGTPVRVRIGGERVLEGAVDEIAHRIDRNAHELTLSGRDAAGILLDCSAPILTAQNLTLEQIVSKVVRPLGISRIRIDAQTQLLRERVSTEPGDTAWDMLSRAAQANGLWPWFEPDGELVVGGPNYAFPPVGALSLPSPSAGPHVLSLEVRRSIAGRYSEVTVLGQRASTLDQSGHKPNIRATVTDAAMTVYRPRTVIDHEATTAAIAKARGSKILSDSALKAWESRVLVAGHRAPDGRLWTAGSRLELTSQTHGVSGTFFIIGRTLMGDRTQGQRTQLTLKQDGVWALYAHPSRRRHRRGRNAMPARIVDLSTGSSPGDM